MSFVFNTAKKRIAAGTFSWVDSGIDVGVLLLNAAAGWTPDPDPLFLDGLDLGVNELGVDGYSRKLLTGRDVIESDDLDLAAWVADDVVWTALGDPDGTAVGGAIIFASITDESDSFPLLFVSDVAGSLAGTDFTAAWDASGLLRFHAPA